MITLFSNVTIREERGLKVVGCEVERMREEAVVVHFRYNPAELDDKITKRRFVIRIGKKKPDDSQNYIKS
jgi:hypothetical protein